jgi:hypothetical protein
MNRRGFLGGLAALFTSSFFRKLAAKRKEPVSYNVHFVGGPPPTTTQRIRINANDVTLGHWAVYWPPPDLTGGPIPHIDTLGKEREFSYYPLHPNPQD